MVGTGGAAAVILLLVVSGSPAYADARADAKAQVAFGIAVAQKGLWREAIYRWERAVDIDPTYAAAYNDLAIAYEQAGMLEKARAAYEKAIALEPKNEVICENYDQFKEIYDPAQRAATRAIGSGDCRSAIDTTPMSLSGHHRWAVQGERGA